MLNSVLLQMLAYLTRPLMLASLFIRQNFRPRLVQFSAGPYGEYFARGMATQSSVDQADVDNFANFTEKDWWDENGSMKALHSMNAIRLPWIRDAVRNNSKKVSTNGLPLSTVSILDVGCGGGILSEPLARLGARVTGIDATEANLTVARRHAQRDLKLSKFLDYKAGQLEDLADGFKEKFDVVIASEILEHVNHPDAFVRSCVQSTAIGGSLFFTTLNRTALSRLLGIWAAERVLKVVPEGIHDWNKFVPPADLEILLVKNGCQVRMLSGLCYNPFTNRWRWIADTSVNYALSALRVA